MTCRIGVDIGGTYTDLVAYDDTTGETIFGKTLTTPASPAEGCLQLIKEAVSKDGIADTEYFLHGTTVGLNSLLERRGAKVGLLITKGFRDILEIRRGDRAEVYNIVWKAPPHLVPRRLCLPVGGRIRYDGEIHEEFVDEGVIAALNVFYQEGVDTIAVAFMNSYANPAHELRAEALLRNSGFTGGISLSHRISGEYREYERTTTTVVDAYVRNRMVNYLSELEQGLQGIGCDATCLITRCGGGSMTFGEAKDRSYETIMSGPVAGAEGAGELARLFGLGNLISADVGGTSFDTCVILEGRPKMKYEGEIIGLPLQTPFVDVRTIGSGGGSIVYVDEGGLLQVGAESAGADPGPACYGRGGTKPTLTDAAFYLGMLGEGKLASGIELIRGKAEQAIKSVAEPLGEDLHTTASGIVAIAGAKMANAIREITVEQGLDPREFTLLVYGGAGPLMGVIIANELSIGHIIVPPYAGNFSAWGMLGADLILTKARTHILPLSPDSLAQANEILATLFVDLETSAGGHETGEGSVRETHLEMRFVGQEHALDIAVRSENGVIIDDCEQSEAAFRQAYKSTFGIELDDPVEISAVRARFKRPLPKRALSPPQPAGKSRENLAHTVDSFKTAQQVDCRIVQRAALEVGMQHRGPAIVIEPTATTYIDVDYTYYVDEHALLHLVKGQEE